MPCRVDPTPREEARGELNADAARLMEWLEWKLDKEEIDATGRLCGLIRSMSNMEFIELLRQNLEDEEAQELAGWWARHQKYDAEYGRWD